MDAKESNRIACCSTDALKQRPESVNGESLPPTNISVRDTFTPDSHVAAELVENAGGSDTDTSRADGSVLDDGRNLEQLSAVKRPASFKPVSFAKFSVTKGAAPNPITKTAADKGWLHNLNGSCFS